MLASGIDQSVVLLSLVIRSYNKRLLEMYEIWVLTCPVMGDILPSLFIACIVWLYVLGALLTYFIHVDLPGITIPNFNHDRVHEPRPNQGVIA